MSEDINIESLLSRIKTLEDEKLVRECMNRYMLLCDELTVDFPLENLTSLFSENAIWEGKGNKYAKTFGRHEGKKSIEAMFAKYTESPAHFSLNVHILGNELIRVNGDKANGSWLLVQPSSFSSGNSQLSCARITARFMRENDCWLISHFQTENLFTRPMDSSWNQSEPLPIPE